VLGSDDVSAGADAVLTVEGVSREFEGARPSILSRRRERSVLAVRDVSFNVHVGEIVGIVGESGSGKTTLARMLVRLLRPSTGTVRLAGRDIHDMPEDQVRREVRPRLRMIFQDPDASLNPAYTIGTGLEKAIRLHAGGANTNAREKVTELLSRVGMDGSYRDTYPDELSGGEKRRLGICRALATDPQVIVADEPLSGLDVVLQERVLQLLLSERERRGFALVLVSHDLDRVHQVCDRVLVMLGGRVVEEVHLRRGEARMRHPYSVLLHDARDGWSGSEEMAGAGTQGEREGEGRRAALEGCVVSSWCGARRSLGSPAVCEQVAPASVGVGEEHAVACHFPEALRGESS